MSEAVSALNGAAFKGYCTVTEAGLTGMVTIRGDFGDKAFTAAVKKISGLDVPGQREIVTKDARKLAWMSPDELLLFCAYGEASDLAAKLAEALAGSHALAVNVSDARVMLRVEGAAAREVIAKLSPANLAPEAFGPGQIRRTRLAQVAAAFHMPDEQSIEVIAFRSVARYVFDLLSTAAKPGSEVGVFPL